MSKVSLLGAALLLFGATLVGCNRTAEGAAEDTKDNAAKVNQAATNAADTTKAAADKAATAAKDTAANAGDIVNLTPKINNAIKMDPALAKTGNEIHVEPKDGVVHLTGHVMTEDMKKLAGEKAQKVLKDMSSNNTLSNDLTVSSK